jgi:hypothetical protein
MFLWIAVAVVMVGPAVVLANPIPCGGFAPHADPNGIECRIYDTTPGVLTIYIVDPGYEMPNGATAWQFKATVPACMIGATYLADGQVLPITIGNSQTGVVTSYGGQCVLGPTHLLTILVYGAGQSQECCFWMLQAHPDAPSGRIESVDCANQIVLRTSGVGLVNPDAHYCVNPTEPTTWGKVKAVYADAQ